MPEALRITGLREFQASLKHADGQSQKQLRIVLNSAAEIVVARARPMVPRRSGRAAGSLKAQSSQRLARVKAGGAAVPYYPWLDFGGAVGKSNSVRRPFFKEGRYIYPAFTSSRGKVEEALEKGLSDLVKKSGL